MGSLEQALKNFEMIGKPPPHLHEHYGLAKPRMMDLKGVKTSTRPRRNQNYPFDPAAYMLHGPSTGLSLIHISDACDAFEKYKVNVSDPRVSRELAAELNQILNNPEMFEQIRKHFPLMDKNPVLLGPTTSGTGLTANIDLPGDTNISLYVGCIIPQEEPEKHYTKKELFEMGLNPPIPSDRKCHGTITIEGASEVVVPFIIIGFNDPDTLKHFAFDPGCIGGSFANHGCEGNCLLDEVQFNLVVRGVKFRFDVPCIRTIKPVKSGMQLTVSYGSEICLFGPAYKHIELVRRADKSNWKRVLKGIPRKLDNTIIRAFAAKSRQLTCVCFSCCSYTLFGFSQTILCMDKVGCVNEKLLLTILGFVGRDQITAECEIEEVAESQPTAECEIEEVTESQSTPSNLEEPELEWRSLRPSRHIFYPGISNSFRQELIGTLEAMKNVKLYHRLAWEKKRDLNRRIASGTANYAEVLTHLFGT